MGFENLDEVRNVPTWPNLVFVIFDYFYMGPQARWGRIEADVTVLPIAQEELPTEFQFSAASPDLFDGGGGVNPAYALWVLLTGKYPYGVGMPKEKIDKISLNAIGVSLASEGIFVNINTADGEKASDLVQEIFDDCGIVTSEVNGLLHFSLIRQGDAALTLDEDGLSPPIEQIEVNAEPFRPRSVEFQYLSNKIGFDQDTINVEQDGFSQYRGSKKRDKLDLKVITQDTIANKVAYRRAQEVFSLQYSVKFTTARDGRILRPGQLVNLPQFGGLRISKVEYDFNSPKVTVTAYTDPYLVPVIDYQEDDGGPKPPGPPFTCPDGTVPVVPADSPVSSPAQLCPDLGGHGGAGGPPSPCATEDCSKPEKPQDPQGCCFGKTGHCEDLPPDQCLKATYEGANGVPQGAGSSCDGGVVCPTPQLGACCQTDGTCSNSFYIDCKGAGGEWDPDNLCYDATTNPSGIECEAPVVGICCGKGLDPPCSVTRTGVCPDGYTYVNSQLECPETDDEYCCTVGQLDPSKGTVLGACCYCDGEQTACVETDILTCVGPSNPFENPIFTPGKSCCELAEDGGCTNDCEAPPPPRLNPDLYVRPLVLPVHLDIRSGSSNSNVIVLRSAADKALATNELYFRNGGSGSGQSAPGGMSNPSIPGGDSFTGMVIPPTQPKHQIEYFQNVNATLFDNDHTNDLVDIEAIGGIEQRKGWFSGNQPILVANSSQILYCRSAKGFSANQSFTGNFFGVLLGRSNSIFPKGCFLNEDVGSLEAGDLIAYSTENLDDAGVTGSIIDRIDSFTNRNAFLMPLGGTKNLNANYTSQFESGTLEFESVPCVDQNDCGGQEGNFVEVDTVTDVANVNVDGVYKNFVNSKLADIPFVRAGSETSSPYNPSAEFRQDTSTTGHYPTSSALGTDDTRICITPGIWKVGVSAGKDGTDAIPAGNHPVVNYDDTLIRKYFSDLVVEIGLPRFAQEQPVPDEKGYGVFTSNLGDLRTYAEETTVRYAVTMWHAVFPNFGVPTNSDAFPYGSVNSQAYRMHSLITKTGTVGAKASGSIFERFTPVEIRTAYNNLYGTNNNAVQCFFNTTRTSVEQFTTIAGGDPGLPLAGYISICLEDNNGKRAVAFIGPSDGNNGGVHTHIDPCQNISPTVKNFPGTKDLRFITPDLGVGIKAVSHWDNTISTVYGNGYKL